MVATHEDQHEAIDATLADHDSQLGLLRRNLDRQFTEIRKISLIHYRDIQIGMSL